MSSTALCRPAGQNWPPEGRPPRGRTRPAAAADAAMATTPEQVVLPTGSAMSRRAATRAADARGANLGDDEQELPRSAGQCSRRWRTAKTMPRRRAVKRDPDGVAKISSCENPGRQHHATPGNLGPRGTALEGTQEPAERQAPGQGGRAGHDEARPCRVTASFMPASFRPNPLGRHVRGGGSATSTPIDLKRRARTIERGEGRPSRYVNAIRLVDDNKAIHGDFGKFLAGRARRDGMEARRDDVINATQPGPAVQLDSGFQGREASRA